MRTRCQSDFPWLTLARAARERGGGSARPCRSTRPLGVESNSRHALAHSLPLVGRPAARLLLPGPAAAQSPTDVLAGLETASRAAEDSLRQGERQLADSRYRGVLMSAWLLLGGLDAADGRWTAAKEAFERASTVAVEQREAVLALALVQLQLGQSADAVTILSRLSSRNPTDLQARRLLAQALAANKQPQQAVQELEEAATAGPRRP